MCAMTTGKKGAGSLPISKRRSRHRKRALSDFAVLYRTNAQSRVIEDALRRNGIPYIIIGGVAFYKRKEIKDVLAYLKLLANPKDDESLLRIINVPARAIGDTTIKRIRSVAASERITMLDALASSKDWKGCSRTVRCAQCASSMPCLRSTSG